MSRESSRDDCEFHEDISEQGFGEYELKPSQSMKSNQFQKINCFRVVECPKSLPMMFVKFVNFGNYNNFQNQSSNPQSSIQFTAIDQNGNPIFPKIGFSTQTDPILRLKVPKIVPKIIESVYESLSFRVDGLP